MKVLDLFQLEGKLALVTGCKRGIGKEMAIALAEAGADIIGVSASLEANGSEIEKAVIAAGRKFYSYQCDFSNRDSLYDFIKNVKTNHPVIDILINNAGTILRKPIAEHPDDFWDEAIAVNQTAPFILTREIGKEMLKREQGKIVFTASLLSYQGGINVPGYAASKGAVAQLTKAFANEWAAKGINVNAIVPGYISTENTKTLREDHERSSSILGRIPANRWGQPADFKGPIVFLCSAAANYIHGSLINVDGGWMGR
ncbi:2-deoxy-D-gluconate 3-dehydrogenase [Flavobacterium sp. PL11]|uniref:SDR family NAD(P)-dependent oxidoreductase n=1 Tax=Flavobacterium sp. PL11 TaxID=3071717 RepID=UPI002DFEE0D7|nr:2-deoxy-D-gluconate 3-dehydrogenase [Flavobacterium sp. PL11]